MPFQRNTRSLVWSHDQDSEWHVVTIAYNAQEFDRDNASIVDELRSQWGSNDQNISIIGSSTNPLSRDEAYQSAGNASFTERPIQHDDLVTEEPTYDPVGYNAALEEVIPPNTPQVEEEEATARWQWSFDQPVERDESASPPLSYQIRDLINDHQQRDNLINVIVQENRQITNERAVEVQFGADGHRRTFDLTTLSVVDLSAIRAELQRMRQRADQSATSLRERFDGLTATRTYANTGSASSWLNTPLRTGGGS